MAVSQNERTGRLGRYLALAAAIHGGAFALGSLRAARAAPGAPIGPVAGRLVDVDVEPASLDPATTTPGGGSPIAGARPVATARPPLPFAPRKVRAAAPTPVSAVEPPRGGRHEPASSLVPEAPPEESEASRMAAVQATDERRERDMGMAQAAAAAGVGPGASGGPGGAGAGWSAPAIRGTTAFGNGRGGALTGRVCFLPVGTLRISDVQRCDYVATVYTDTLDIPERQYSDGFPGVTNRSDWFLIDYTGEFTVTGYGTYVFRLHSDDGSYLYVDDALVIDNDGKHAPESRTGRVQLAVGVHRIKVRYAQTTDRMALQLFVRTPQGSVETIFRTQM
jgi:PA14 domain